uniref:Uncharacterized protein n=1 Tax=Eutreptiella gymnastica TaxID=73025 RepID=A0A7S1IH14_9EUGL
MSMGITVRDMHARPLGTIRPSYFIEADKGQCCSPPARGGRVQACSCHASAQMFDLGLLASVLSSWEIAPLSQIKNSHFFIALFWVGLGVRVSLLFFQRGWRMYSLAHTFLVFFA